jgi:hypothetical protein
MAEVEVVVVLQQEFVADFQLIPVDLDQEEMTR